MNDIRTILEKLGKINESATISESYNVFDWGITDPVEIRAHVIENLVQYQSGGGWQRGTFAQLLLAYLSALKIDPNESQAMKEVMASAVNELVEDYKIFVKDDKWLSFGEDMMPAIAKLRQMGLQSKKLDAIEKDFAKREQRLNAKYSDNTPD